jgi:ATP-dependent Clp protease ATP-binding subunit ClpA/ActR/RegA family two-component response regulator
VKEGDVEAPKNGQRKPRARKASATRSQTAPQAHADVPALEAPERIDLVQMLSRKVVGQPAALQYIVPYLQMYEAGLSPTDRPAGIFLLLGPSGTGKTRTVEALAEILHGNARQILKVDCGELQSDHDVARLVGAPPGYIGHRETKPILTTERLLGATSPKCDLALVLFDEIEKAAPTLTVLLLGILDKAILRLGDNTTVNFEKALIFLTSNLGAREMMRAVAPDIGFGSGRRPPPDQLSGRLEAIALAAVRKRFSPEFVNRIDVVVTYQPLDADALARILDQHVEELQRHVHSRLADRSFAITVTPAARQLLLDRGTSPEYGARELKRVVHRLLTQPLAALVADGRIPAGARVSVDLGEEGDRLAIRPEAAVTAPAAEAARPRVLILDDNEPILKSLGRALTRAGFDVVTFASVGPAIAEVRARPPDLALLDVILPDGDGVSVACDLIREFPRVRVVLMTGMELAPEEEALRQRYDIPLLRKPFLAREVTALVEAQLEGRQASASRTAGTAGSE